MGDRISDRKTNTNRNNTFLLQRQDQTVVNLDVEGFFKDVSY
jgi:hypothetical protein